MKLAHTQRTQLFTTFDSLVIKDEQIRTIMRFFGNGFLFVFVTLNDEKVTIQQALS